MPYSQRMNSVILIKAKGYMRSPKVKQQKRGIASKHNSERWISFIFDISLRGRILLSLERRSEVKQNCVNVIYQDRNHTYFS